MLGFDEITNNINHEYEISDDELKNERIGMCRYINDFSAALAL